MLATTKLTVLKDVILTRNLILRDRESIILKRCSKFESRVTYFNSLISRINEFIKYRVGVYKSLAVNTSINL